MSVEVRHLTNGKKEAYVCVYYTECATDIYENLEDVPERSRDLVCEETEFIEPDAAWFLGVQDYFYPNFQKCELSEFAGQRCIAENCAEYDYKHCPHSKKGE